MLEVITKVFCFTMLTILDFHIMKKLLNSSEKIFSVKTIILSIVIIAVSSLGYEKEYLVQPILVRTIISLIIYRFIFDESVYKVTIAFLTVMFMELVADLANTIIYVNILPIASWRNTWYQTLLTNTTIAITTLLISRIPIFSKRLKAYFQKLKKENIKSTIIVFMVSFLVIINLLYNLYVDNRFNKYFLTNYIIILVFFILLIIFIIENNKYNKLIDNYDIMFDYVKNFEEVIDDMSLNNHEFKNQLIMLKSYVETSENKKALHIIKDITKEHYKEDNKILLAVKNLPKGGIKGLVYYKIMVATNNELKISVDISKSVKRDIEKLDIDKTKILCQLIGIYLDNAIDASKECNNKLIGIEIYKIDSDIIFTFSNSFKNENISIKDLEQKGFTTKGKGHGQGLYLAKKILHKNNWISAKTKIINNMYVQQISIKKTS